MIHSIVATICGCNIWLFAMPVVAAIMYVRILRVLIFSGVDKKSGLE
jgi:hypothetical protein